MQFLGIPHFVPRPQLMVSRLPFCTSKRKNANGHGLPNEEHALSMAESPREPTTRESLVTQRVDIIVSEASLLLLLLLFEAIETLPQWPRQRFDDSYHPTHIQYSYTHRRSPTLLLRLLLRQTTTAECPPLESFFDDGRLPRPSPMALNPKCGAGSWASLNELFSSPFYLSRQALNGNYAYSLSDRLRRL